MSGDKDAVVIDAESEFEGAKKVE
ncbi:MAG: hypothetical protein RL215_3486, partial [Planctomycetota bacterium]